MRAALIAQPGTDPGSLDQVIPAVKGEFYSYVAEFSPAKPIYCLMKCKASKSWPATPRIGEILAEVDLVFAFGRRVLGCSPASEAAATVLGGLGGLGGRVRFNRTEIRVAKMDEAEFNERRLQRSGGCLAEVFLESEPTDPSDVVQISLGAVLSLRTSTGKFGLCLVTDLSEGQVRLEACHMLI